MTNGRGRHKSRNKARAKKTSKGIHGAVKHPLSAVERVLLGKGQFRTMKHVPGVTWMGVGNVTVPYDAAQAAINRKQFPHLFDPVSE